MKNNDSKMYLCHNESLAPCDLLDDSKSIDLSFKERQSLILCDNQNLSNASSTHMNIGGKIPLEMIPKNTHALFVGVGGC